ncbi:MAG: enoyl-CoA hydratase-related protein [Myxococcota bacterium]|nr:enoyl-CoA hydratase-related protein [Myxococcota bacterium]
MAEDFETILLAVDEQGVALLTINRPQVRNALNQTMVDEIGAALKSLEGRDDIRTLIFTGAGDKAFLGGADIAELKARDAAAARKRINTNLFAQIERFPMPTIAAVRGFALGGGCELALACDLRICGQGAKFGQPEVALGIIPGAGATYRLPRVVGQALAKELILTGRIFGADEALAMGLVSKVVADDGVLESAYDLAAEINKNGALAVRMAKEALNASGLSSLEEDQLRESEMQAVLFEDEDKHQRMQAFLDRKKK